MNVEVAETAYRYLVGMVVEAEVAGAVGRADRQKMLAALTARAELIDRLNRWAWLAITPANRRDPGPPE